jgi:RsiW-degrading membrane proteinase PrsW (M82 family)
MNAQTIIALLISTGIPLLFLLLIYTQDLYASRTFRLVLVCFLWGALGGFVFSYLFNTYVALPLIFSLGLSTLWLYVAFAPVAEEILKSLSFLYISRRPDFTYFVDGAIYGFAAGIGFSIIENYLYISQRPWMAIPLALTRAFSTCLMHGSAAALVGVAVGVGRIHIRKRSTRALAMLGGWAAAILLHVLFNGQAQVMEDAGTAGTLVAVVIGLAGVGLIVFFIWLGLREQRQWLAETLDREVGVTGAEVRAAQAFADLEEILEPITKQFPEKAEQVEKLVLAQAQLGIKRKVHRQIDDAKQKTQLSEDIGRLQADMDRLRREVGPWVWNYVRLVFPEGKQDLWGNLESLAIRSGPPDLQRWAHMLTGEAKESSGPSIWEKASGKGSPEP